MRPGAEICPVEAPITRAHHRWLRALVLAHNESESRRRHPPVLHAAYLGHRPARLRLTKDEVDDLDHALRVDLWEALVVRARWSVGLRDADPVPAGPWLWLTTEGRLDDDLDPAWLRSVRAAATESGVICPFVVVVRNGWRDPITGVRREWVRLRRAR